MPAVVRIETSPQANNTPRISRSRQRRAGEKASEWTGRDPFAPATAVVTESATTLSIAVSLVQRRQARHRVRRASNRFVTILYRVGPRTGRQPAAHRWPVPISR